MSRLTPASCVELTLLNNPFFLALFAHDKDRDY